MEKMTMKKVLKFLKVLLKFLKKLQINIVIFIKVTIFQQFYKQVKLKLSYRFLVPQIYLLLFLIKKAS